MNAILLVGGLGTRLRPLTLTQPKALLPVLNKPFLTYQLDLLRDAGATHVMLAAGKIIHRWEKEIKSLEKPGLKIHFAYEPSPLGTGGAVRFSYEALKKKNLLTKGPILIFNGDIFFDFDAADFLAFHQKKKSQATILLTRVKDPTRFGVISVGPGARVLRFVEKPKDGRFGNLINAGAYAMEPEWIERIPRGKVVSVERETFPQSLASKSPISGYVMKGYWNDIGTPATYLKAHRDLLTVSNRWTRTPFFRKRGSLPDKGLVVMGRSSSVGKNVRFSGIVCCGNNVVLDSNCSIQDSVLMDGVVVREGSVIEGSILGRNCRIEKFSKISQGSVLGDETTFPPFTRC